MSISINPITFVIYVPKEDISLTQASPEVRTLDLNEFRLWLKDWEDSAEGISMPKTHNHNTEATLSGLTYARIIDILSPYTIEFEDGQYTINCVGANHNISDRKVGNQVSLIVNNAAGLITNTAIEYASYNSGVMIDVNSTTTGTLFPAGTIQSPVNNLTDAKLIADSRGFRIYYIVSDLTISTDDNIEDKQLIGINPIQTVITIESAALTARCTITNATVQGILDGDSQVYNCSILNLEYVNGELHDCELKGTITLGGGAQASFVDCYSGIAGSSMTPIIDMGGSGQSLLLRDYHGGVEITNKSGPEAVSIDMSSGQLKFDNTVTNGLITCRGVGYITQNDAVEGVILNQMLNTDTVASDVWNSLLAGYQIDGSAGKSLSTASSGGVDYDTLSAAVWDRQLSLHTTDGSAGQMVKEIDDIEAGDWELSNNQMIFRDKVGAEIFRVNLFNDEDIGSMENVYKRTRI